MTVMGGGSRSNGDYWTWHLQRTDGGQTFAIRDVVGLMGQDMGGWFEQMKAMSLGGNTDRYFYHFHLDPRSGEAFTPEQLKVAVATALENLGLDGQPYFLVEHDKDGRSPHFHCIVLRVDLDTGKAISDSHNYRVHQRTADQLEELFGHQRTNRDRSPDGPNPEVHEVQRGRETGIDRKAVAAELKDLWRESDTGQAFAAALEEHGYILADGDRGFVVIDQAGGLHSIARRLGVKAAEVNARLADIDLDTVPTVAEAKALAKERAADRDKRDDRDQAPAGTQDKDRSAFELLADELLETTHGASPADPLPVDPPKPDAAPTLAQDAEQLANEAAPLLADLASAALAAEEHEAPAERSAFDRFAADIKNAMREGGGEPLASEGSRWLADRAGYTPSRPEPSTFGRFVRRMKEAMRAGGGEPESVDGLSLWQRAAAVFTELRDQALSWAGRVYDSVAERFSRSGRDRDDSGRER